MGSRGGVAYLLRCDGVNPPKSPLKRGTFYLIRHNLGNSEKLTLDRGGSGINAL
jgi:hypothetical protein